MSRVLLDTTALLAHYLDEPGAGQPPAEARERALDYAGLCDLVVPVDTALGVRAFDLSAETTIRVPLIDTLIAAAAQLSDASLVHRDIHFRLLTSVRQLETAP